MGMLVGVEIVTDKESRKPNKDAAELLVYKYVLKHYRTSFFEHKTFMENVTSQM